MGHRTAYGLNLKSDDTGTVPSRFHHGTLPLTDALRLRLRSSVSPKPHPLELVAAALQSSIGMGFESSLARGSRLPLPRARRQAGHGETSAQVARAAVPPDNALR